MLSKETLVRMYECAWEYVFKNQSLLYSEAKKKINELKGDTDDEDIILFWNILRV